MGCSQSHLCLNSELLMTQRIELESTSCLSQEKALQVGSPSFASGKKLITGAKYPESKLRTALSLFAGSSANLTDAWERLVYSQLERSVMCSEDITTTLTQDSSGTSVTLTHAVDGLRSYQAIIDFCKEIDADFNEAAFDETQAFFSRVCPLTVTFYLTLGRQLDYGIGLRKPVPSKLLDEFYQRSAARSTIKDWIAIYSQPIATELKVSCRTQTRSCSFYLFEGSKTCNIENGLSILTHFADAYSGHLSATLQQSSSEELWCEIVFTSQSVKALSVTTSSLSDPNNLCRRLVSPYNERLWRSFKAALGNTSYTIEWQDGLFTMHQTSSAL